MTGTTVVHSGRPCHKICYERMISKGCKILAYFYTAGIFFITYVSVMFYDKFNAHE